VSRKAYALKASAQQIDGDGDGDEDGEEGEDALLQKAMAESLKSHRYIGIDVCGS
jgi:hypothetical protein